MLLLIVFNALLESTNCGLAEQHVSVTEVEGNVRFNSSCYLRMTFTISDLRRSRREEIRRLEEKKKKKLCKKLGRTRRHLPHRPWKLPRRGRMNIMADADELKIITELTVKRFEEAVLQVIRSFESKFELVLASFNDQ